MRNLFPRDNIPWRFALAMGLSVVLVAALVATCILFNKAQGLQQPLERQALVGEVADLASVIEAAPPTLRPKLIQRTTGQAIQLSWSQSGAPLSKALDTLRADQPDRTAGERGPEGTVLVLDNPHGLAPPGLKSFLHAKAQHQIAAARLSDGSWIVFASKALTLAPPIPLRIAALSTLVGVSILVIALLAAPYLSRPLRRVTDAVTLFGVNLQAPALDASGPEEMRQVIAALNDTQERIRRFVADRMTMLAAISHDLRTPLTRMRLRGEFIADPRQRQKLFNDVEEMQAMVDSALAFFRDDASGEATTPFDVAGVLRTLVNDLADQGVHVAFQSSLHVICMGRPFSIKRAFANLVENAAKYGASPSVTLEAGPSVISVVIRDHGPGIPPNALEQVFTPFFRLESSRNRSTGGVGLGLPTARTIIESHGGQVILRNHPAGGLEAFVTLPPFIKPSRAPGQQRPVYRPQSPRGTAAILSTPSTFFS